jgi:predicted DNA-binding transcriptional regulator YafY
MPDPTARALTLLDLLQSHRHRPASELAERMGVTVRTVRRDIERLRDLGYRVDAAPGVLGGYRLEAGAALPPLVLSDEEAVAIAIGLRTVATGRLRRGAESALSALAKLEQVLPAPLRRRVKAHAPTFHRTPSGTEISSQVLTDLALACRDSERVRLTYRPPAGDPQPRRVEPAALAPLGPDWYLVCWDLGRDDWRTFRVDRIPGVEPLRVRFRPRPLPPEQVDEMIAVARTWGPRTEDAAVVVDLPIEEFHARFGAWAQGATEAGPGRTRWPIAAASARDLAYGLSWLPPETPYRVEVPEPERAELKAMLSRMLDALDR